VEYQLTARGLFDAEAAALLNDPAKIPGPRGMAEMFYNNMPAKIDEAVQLKLAEPELWSLVKRFYKEVRNPLFHGYQLRPVG
jgi:hypothetical protein